MSASTSKFSAGELVWAKMKGFPPWPARVSPTDASSDIPSGRVQVMFFGTRETAFMKPSDIFSYLDNRHNFEVPRKHKGFNEGVNEIRVAAGLPADALFSGAATASRSPSPAPATRSHRSSNNSKLFADVFLPVFDRKRTASNSSFKGRSRTSSSASLMKSLAKNRMLSSKRLRLDSGSSAGSKALKNVMIGGGFAEQKLVLDALDQLSPLEGLEGGILEQREEDARSMRSRGSSKVFEEYMMNAGRVRTRSGSEGKRSRLISGVSDVFDELFEQAHTVFSAEALMLAIDNLHSEGSGQERARTPEAPSAPLPAPVKFCIDCGCECQLYGVKWRCTSKFCLKWNGTHDPFAPPSSQEDEKKRIEDAAKEASHAPSPHFQEAPQVMVKEERVQSPARMKRKVRVASPSPPIRSPRRSLGIGRPKQYKVEKTPPVGENGQRSCVFCSGQVRPQMCGGNKHRWRCVDKKCRKWYGWVRSNEEIPKDLGKKGERWRQSERESEAAMSVTVDESAAAAAAITEASPPRRKVGRPPKHHGLQIKLNTKKDADPDRPKRKYTKRKDREATKAAGGGGGGGGGTPTAPVRESRPLSPLTIRQAGYRPSAMERRARWWRSEKRKADYSPPRTLKADNLDVASAFRMISQACMAAAVTRADETGTVAGTLDLLMDTMASSLGPIFSLFNTLPDLAHDRTTSTRLWDASLVHTPIFQ